MDAAAKRCDRGGIRDVEQAGSHRRAGPSERLSCDTKRRIVHVDEHQFGAVAGELLGDGAADPRRAAGDEHALALQGPHDGERRASSAVSGR